MTFSSCRQTCVEPVHMCVVLFPVTAVRLRYSQRMAASPSFARTTKASQLFSEPLASEGEGSVFPVELPLSKRFVKAEVCSTWAGGRSGLSRSSL